jgi:hypothetical protein
LLRHDLASAGYYRSSDIRLNVSSQTAQSIR